MDIAIISIVAFFTAILTFFSGFGLGTSLMPVFALFCPIDLAIALTGVVHFFNKLFKLGLVGKSADKTVLVRFGIPAIIAAFAGAWVLLNITDLKPLFSYAIGDRTFTVMPLNFIIAILLIILPLLISFLFLTNFNLVKKSSPLGGVLSGFFGGLSGHQGALRSAFLIMAGLSKDAFIATAVVIACFIDFTRLAVYATRFTKAGLIDNLTLVISATLAAIASAYFGMQLLKKVTLVFIQRLVAVMLLGIGIALGLGVIYGLAHYLSN